MEKVEMTLRRVAVSLLLSLSCLCSARGAEKWGLGAGVRDSYYIFAQASYADSYLGAEHSIYSYDAKYQYWRLYTGSGCKIPYAELGGRIFYGRTWCGNYWNAGALLTARVLPPGPVSVFATLNPLYDSGLKYHTCFAAGAAVRIFKPVSLRASYTTIPEFRESEKRVRAGVEVKVGGLSVVPELSIPTNPTNRSRRLRLLMSFSYLFSVGR